ncbi:MAG: restriction endonuclease subunit S [Spirochaetaceae bacterium]|nr:restriction endonuclease subunit S [Spirochaetaceae bacterium]
MATIIEKPLSEIVEINRGASLSPKEIERRTVSENTGIQYFKIFHIKNNYIEEDLPFLCDIEDREYKYLLKENDIVLTKIGEPKFALAKNLAGRKIIVTQNLYILRIKENVHPLYIKAFFESELGFKRLEAAYIHNTIPMLTVKNLEKVMIPIFADEEESLQMQEEFVKSYEAEETKEQELIKQYTLQRQKRLGMFDEMVKDNS